MFTKPWSRRFKWLAYISAIYTAVAFTAIFSGYSEWFEFIQIVWILVLSIPFFCPPVNRWLDMDKKVPEDKW